MTTRHAAKLGVALVLCLSARSAPAQTARYLPGIFVSTPAGPVELIAFAELMSNGTLKMASGTLEDVPTIRPALTMRVLAALPNWPPAGVMMATAELFRDEFAERRTLPFAARRVNVSSVEIRIADLEQVQTTAKLLRSIRASERAPGYVFIIVASSGIARYYPMRLAINAE